MKIGILALHFLLTTYIDLNLVILYIYNLFHLLSVSLAITVNITDETDQ